MPYKDKEKQKASQREHYLNNKNSYLCGRKKRRERNKHYIYSKKTLCKKCGLDDKICLDFHHLFEKNKNVSSLINDATTFDKIDSEIEKCEILCGNCHRKEHSISEIVDGSGWKNFNHARIEKRKWFIQYMKNQICIECGESDHRCLEHHHLNDKRFTISKLLTSGHSIEFLQEEIKRCLVLCTNCHRKKHQIGV